MMRQLGDVTRRRLPNALVDGLDVNLVQAGHPGGMDLPRILGIKVTLASVGALLFVLNGKIIFAVIAAVILFFFPDYWVLSVRDKRRAEIRSAAADLIDQMTICVEAGLGFESALGRVATTNAGPLSDELRHTMSDIAAGVPRAQALRALADRADIVEIRQLVSALLQAQKHGVSMAETLRIQSAEMRLKRAQATEEKAAKLTVKIIFPIIVCFMPVFVIVTLVPSLITVFKAL
jgi:tight adherence protein C